MADKAISELPLAVGIRPEDSFVLEQDGSAKRLMGETLSMHLKTFEDSSEKSAAVAANAALSAARSEEAALESQSMAAISEIESKKSQNAALASQKQAALSEQRAEEYAARIYASEDVRYIIGIENGLVFVEEKT